MKVFVTGSTGFIGTAVLSELTRSGHKVVAFTRSETAARKVKAIAPDATFVHGTLDDLAALERGAKEADGIIHMAFIYDFAQYQLCVEKDRLAILTMLEAIKDTNKIFVGTSILAGFPAGRLGTEDDASNCPRGETERLALAYNRKGVRVNTVRLPPTVHGEGDKAFVPYLIQVARNAGKSCFIEDGSYWWPAVHRLDLAKLFCLALEKGQPGKVYHGAAEEGIETRRIAQAIGEILSVPVTSISRAEADRHFGFLATFFASDMQASSKKTQSELGWKPTCATLLEDIRGTYK